MADKLIVHGLDLSELGIGDVVEYQPVGLPIAEMGELMRQILGSITFGPLVVDMYDPEDEEDDWTWEYAE